MNPRRIGSTAGAVLLASTLGACSAQQQDPQCLVGRGAFATVYTLKDGQDPGLACAHLKPEPVGLEKYFSQDPNGMDSVGLRPRSVGTLLTAAGKDPKTQVDADALQPHSVGELKADAPGPDNFCEVSMLNPTRLVTRAIAEGGTDRTLTYEWSNLRIYSTPQIPGTQFVADLRYTDNGCIAEYKVKGMWPVVKCDTDDKPDDSKCDPKPDPSVGRTEGSGINPIFPVKCDPDALICVLTGEVPSAP
jgi:hypothetical protein